MVCLCRLPCVINSWGGGHGRESGVGFGLAEIVVGEGAFPSIREGFSFASHSHGMMLKGHWIRKILVGSKYDAAAMAYLISNRECDSTEENLENVESGRSLINRRQRRKDDREVQAKLLGVRQNKTTTLKRSLAKIKKSSRIHHKILTCRTRTLHPSGIPAILLITRRNASQHPVPLPIPRCMLPSQHQSISRTLYPPNNSNAFDKVAGAW